METATSPSIIANKEPHVCPKQSNKPKTKVKSVKNKRKVTSKTKTAKIIATPSQHQCPVHCNATQNNVTIEASSEVTSEMITPPTDTPTKDHDTSESINISSPTIPETQSVSVGVDMNEEEVLEMPCSSHSEVDAFNMACEDIIGSSRLAQNDLTCNFSTAVSDLMAEPIPSNCIVSSGVTNVGEVLEIGTVKQQMMGGQEKSSNSGETQCHQGEKIMSE